MGRPQPTVPRLELIENGQVTSVVPLDGVDFVIGREPNHVVSFDDKRVSKSHARVEVKHDGTCRLIDLGSRNHTYVEGMRLKPFVPYLLREGQRIKIVDHVLVFRDAFARVVGDATHESTVIGQLPDPAAAVAAVAEISRTNDRRSLKAVLDVNTSLRGAGGLDEMSARVLQALLEVFPKADRAFLITREPDGSMPIRAFKGRNAVDALPTLSTTILDRVLTKGQALLISDADAETSYAGHGSIAGTLRSAVCVPLLDASRTPIGMIQIDATLADHIFSVQDLELVVALAVPVGVAIENAGLYKLQASLAAAREIQEALLPHGRPSVDSYSFWDCYRPAQLVGGDLYDYISRGSGWNSPFVASLGDVSGKGIPAAVIMAGVCPELRLLVRSGEGLGAVLSRLNRDLYERGFDGRFVTLTLAEVDHSRHEVTLTAAGHQPPILRKADGTVREMDEVPIGPPLGVDPEAEFGTVTVPIEPGDFLLIYSDGVVDATSLKGELFGLNRLLKAVAEAPASADAAGEEIFAHVREHAAGRSQFDDITMLCIGRNPDTGDPSSGRLRSTRYA